MTVIQTRHIALAEDFCSRATIPLMSAMALKVAHLALTWNERHVARAKLATLDHNRLMDLGITRQDAVAEARKPFWRA